MFKKYEVLSVLVLLGLGVWYLYPLTAEERYDKYYKLWKSHNIKRYAYTLVGSSSSFGPQVLRIVVYNNMIINIYKPHNLKQKVNSGFPAYTIDDKFHDIEVSLSEQSVAVYDNMYGFPKYNEPLSNPTANESGNIMLGFGYFYQIKNFRILPINISNEYQPVCAKNIIIKPCMDKVCPILSSDNKTYKNRDMMDIAGAYFNHEGEC